MADTNSDFVAFREKLEALQRRWSEEDAQSKVSNRVTIRLAQFYQQTDPVKREMFDRLLAEWVRSRELGTLFDGMALISEFRVCSALPAVREALAQWKVELAQYSDLKKGGEYGVLRSHALSGVSMLEDVARGLEAGCEGAR